MRRVRVLVAGVALLMLPAMAQAQEMRGPQPADAAQMPVPRLRPPAPQPVLRAYFLYDVTSLAAADTFEAVIGGSRVSMRGAGGEVLRVWKGVFARAAFSSGTETGSRVAVFGNDVVTLDIPVTIEMRPFEIGAGWRFRPLAEGRVVPYAGAGILRLRYRETSMFAQPGENTSETFQGRVLFGGIEAALGGWFIAGAEVQHRSIPDAIGQGGVSQMFDEDDLGGVTIRVLFGIRR